MKKRIKIVTLILLILSICIIYFAIRNPFSEIEKKSLLDIPNGSSWIKKETNVNDFDGGKMSFYVIRIDSTEVADLTRQALSNGYKYGPLTEISESAFKGYLKSNDSVVYKMMNVVPPDFEIIIINLSSGHLIYKSIDIFK